MQSTIERLSEEALFNAQSEVGDLVGAEIKFRLKSASLIKKQGYLESQDDRTNIIGLKMSGTYEGEGCLLTSENSVVRLGGKMLMLPPSEINEIISKAGYKIEDELRYAFDEIAKCLVASFLKPFQRSKTYISTITCQTQKSASGRREITATLNHLSAEQTYYQVTATIELAGVGANDFSLLLPAFVLVCSEPFQMQTVEHTESSLPASVEHPSDRGSIFGLHLSKYSTSEESVTGEATADELIAHLVPGLESELANLLDSRVEIRIKDSGVVHSNELFQEPQDVPLLHTALSVTGSYQGRGWLVTELTDATQLGMLMTEGSQAGLIPVSLAARFSADCQDGYREICSILLDVLFIFCQKLSDGVLTIEKEALPAVEEEPQEAYLNRSDSGHAYRFTSLEFTANGIPSGTIHVFLPLDMLKGLKIDEYPTMLKPRSSPKINSAGEAVSGSDSVSPAQKGRLETPPRVLVIEASESNVLEVQRALKRGGIEEYCVSPAQELQKQDLESYMAVLLVIEKLDEIILGLVIKIKSLVAIPLLVAAPQWTQTDVMKALRYGVDDIVMLPVESGELVHKLKGLEPITI